MLFNLIVFMTFLFCYFGMRLRVITCHRWNVKHVGDVIQTLLSLSLVPGDSYSADCTGWCM